MVPCYHRSLEVLKVIGEAGDLSVDVLFDLIKC